MTTSTEPPKILLNPLPQSDGSCQYTQGLTTIISSVNGPIEVKPRDELPTEATVEVIIKPGIGVGGTREKYLEQVLQKTLRSLILLDHHPRTLIQIVAQIVGADDHTSIPILLSPLLNSCFLSLLAASIPLKTTFFSTHIAILPPSDAASQPTIIRNPTKEELRRCSSSHTIGYSKEEELVFVDSRDCSNGKGGDVMDGTGRRGWKWSEWVAVTAEAAQVCCKEGVDITRALLAAQ